LPTESLHHEPCFNHLPAHRSAISSSSRARRALAGCGGGGARPVERRHGCRADLVHHRPHLGFRPIIVNGVRYDDSAAQVFDDDGNRSSRDALKPGMRV
jgi:hypothetical protein